MQILYKFLFIWIFVNHIPSSESIRFATYNIQSGSDYEHVYNLSVTAATIDQFAVDFIALQEVDNSTNRHPIDQTLFIAEYNTKQPFQYFHFEKMRNFQNGGYGISILSKQASVKNVFTYHYNNKTAEQCVTPTDGDYCQGFILFQIPVHYPGATDLSIYFGTTHLGIGLNGAQQRNEAQQIVEWMTKKIINVDPRPFIILMTGDFNVIPTDPTINNIMLSLFTDLWTTDTCRKIPDPSNVNGYTFDSLNPSKRIDYIFMYKSENFPTEIKINCEIQVLPTLSSDHRPVLLKFDFLQ